VLVVLHQCKRDCVECEVVDVLSRKNVLWTGVCMDSAVVEDMRHLKFVIYSTMGSSWF
jgi:hypothetical protein